MGYSNFKSLKLTLEKLNLEETDEILFPQIDLVAPSEWLLQTLLFAKRLPLTNEKSKSERVISPILAEVALYFEKQFTMFSGEDLTVDSSKDLSGECDFFFAQHPRKSVMQAPVVTFVEAKDEDFEYGQAQCTAQMYASMLYNEQKGKPVPYIYGCAVTGDVWKFLKLEKGKITLDTENYYLIELPKILGIFHQILNSFLR
ncbi:MAG: hypothetical protein EAZ44_01980 [Cytophagia bacterium]|nr:MAG: hypothetical protein EAY69_03860 [Cytophagales bacterium]TAG06634.1 MAG: hypothetical protein EAZ44_01980 [Cytophagia bacterium]TAG46336.1 MAG: hypothetical protein EAZ31_00485 [Cytophagia bacterium]